MSTLLNIVEHGTFELYVEKPYFKFNAAHFIVHEVWRGIPAALRWCLMPLDAGPP